MLKIMRHNPQSLPHIPDVPPFFAKQTNGCLIIGNRMDFTGQQFQESRFACAIGTKDGGVFPCWKHDRTRVIEHTGVPPIDRRSMDVENQLTEQTACATTPPTTLPEARATVRGRPSQCVRTSRCPGDRMSLDPAPFDQIDQPRHGATPQILILDDLLVAVFSLVSSNYDPFVHAFLHILRIGVDMRIRPG